MNYRCDLCDAMQVVDDLDLGKILRCKNCLSMLEIPEEFPGVGFVLGDFYLRELLGEGGHGEVYLAQQLNLERNCAVKIFDELAVDADVFYREVKQTALLNHCGIVQSYFAGTEDGLHYFAMELVERGSLGNYILDRGLELSENELINLIIELVEALKYSWLYHGLIHCDVKLDNLLLTENFGVKLSDFGISECWKKGVAINNEMVSCSPMYAAPEVLRGEAVSIASDMYSVGVIMYECLSGERLFRGSSVEEIYEQKIDGNVKSKISSLQVGWRTKKIMKKLLANDVLLRYETHDDLLDDLKNCRGKILGHFLVLMAIAMILVIIVGIAFSQFSESMMAILTNF